MDIRILHKGMTVEHLGFIPMFVTDLDSRPVKEQFDENYAHGGGWSPMEGWTLCPDMSIQYQGDQPLKPLALITVREEKIYYYEGDWVAIVQPNGDFEVSRMD